MGVFRTSLDYAKHDIIKEFCFSDVTNTLFTKEAKKLNRQLNIHRLNYYGNKNQSNDTRRQNTINGD